MYNVLVWYTTQKNFVELKATLFFIYLSGKIYLMSTNKILKQHSSTNYRF